MWAWADSEEQRFCKEAIVWKYVSCRYILKFDGVFYCNDVPAIVTPWMPHGNITEYLEKHPDVNRLRLVGLNIPRHQAKVHFASSRHIVYRCDQRGQVSPQLQHSARGYQRGKPSIEYCGGFDHEKTGHVTSRTSSFQTLILPEPYSLISASSA